MFLYELHAHTAEASKCASMPGKELAKLYHEKGYAGIAVTDHFYQGNTAVDRDLPWEEWVDRFCRGYENVRDEGKKYGLQVFFGWEYCDQGTEFLTYGLEKSWLLKHPELAEIKLADYCRLIHEAGGILVHAHPFRQRNHIKMIRLLPNLTDAVETVNKTNEPRANFLADQYADNFGLKKVGGTDFHRPDHAAAMGGIALPAEVFDIRAVFQAVMAEKIRIL
ncbi:MAG: histidinol phosphatase [Clostridiales bacterium]|nr:MAG: histidinol phosphatase [Clostridiales bacterium]